MAWLVARFRDGSLIHASVCRTMRSTKRVANQSNEHAQMMNKLVPGHLYTVSIFEDSVLAAIARLHVELPKHLPKEVLDKRRKKPEPPRFEMFTLEL